MLHAAILPPGEGNEARRHAEHLVRACNSAARSSSGRRTSFERWARPACGRSRLVLMDFFDRALALPGSAGVRTPRATPVALEISWPSDTRAGVRGESSGWHGPDVRGGCERLSRGFRLCAGE